LFTNQRRFRRGLTSSAACPFCSSPETTEHLFLHCISIQPFWRAIPSLHRPAYSLAYIDYQQFCTVLHISQTTTLCLYCLV
jgi:hypothetical protein